MKKIIAAFDGLKFSESTMQYAVALARQTGMHLVGIFLDDITYTSYKIYELIGKEGVSEKKLKELEKHDIAARRKAAGIFEKACRDAGLNYSIHHDRRIALKELIHESIYADLLVIDRKETLTHYEEKPPTHFIRDLLTDVQCPVMLVNKKYRAPEKIILLYDGEPSSVHAIKMFSYMLPELKEIPTEVLSVKGMGNDLHLPDNKLMKEFIKYHFPEVKVKVLKGLAEIEIVKEIRGKRKNALIVLGAYRRGMVSRWFKASMADELMIELENPLFIAHNK